MFTSLRLGTTHFSLEKQVAFITGHGTLCTVIPTIACPCLTLEGLADPLCGECRGTGRYPQETEAFDTMLLLTRFQATPEYHEEGAWTRGSIQATVLPGVQLTERWLVRVRDMSVPFDDEVLQKDILDRVRFREGVVLRLVRDRTLVYVPGVDYALHLPNLVDWLAGGTAPAPFAHYSVSYEAQPEFMVFMPGGTPRVRVEHRRNYAQVVRLMRLDQIDRA